MRVYRVKFDNVATEWVDDDGNVHDPPVSYNNRKNFNPKRYVEDTAGDRIYISSDQFAIGKLYMESDVASLLGSHYPIHSIKYVGEM